MIKRTNSTRILAALSAANDAILRITSRKELHQRVCDAIVEGRALVAVSIFLDEADGRLGYVAGAGKQIEMLGRPEELTDPTSAGTQDLVTPAFHSGLSRIANDIQSDERERAEERIEYLAKHDHLTDLPNRAMFDRLPGFSIRTARRNQRQGAVLFTHLDRCKVIKASLAPPPAFSSPFQTALAILT